MASKNYGCPTRATPSAEWVPAEAHRIVALPLIDRPVAVCKDHLRSPEWRNWQTRWIQNPVPVEGVWVRVPPPVLERSLGLVGYGLMQECSELGPNAIAAYVTYMRIKLTR